MTLRRPNAASLTCLLLAGLGLALGVWQWQRSLYKLDLAEKRARVQASVMQLGKDSAALWQADISAQAWDQQTVRLTGVWKQDRQIYLDNRAHEGRAGVHVLTPLHLPDGSLVWVNRGWAPRMPGSAIGSSADQAAQGFVTGQAHPAPEGSQTLQAVGQASLMRRIELSQDPKALRQGALWQNFDPEAAAQWLNGTADGQLRVWPLIFWQTSEADDGLVRSLPKVGADAVAVHRGYALQWWLLMLVALFFAWRLSQKDSS
nr:hypothetical protein NCPCFENI_00149 [Cupriavidus sp.]